MRRNALLMAALCAAPAVSQPGLAQDRWVYDNYPTLGVSAFVTGGDGHILALGCTGGDGLSQPPLALRAGGEVLLRAIPDADRAASPGLFAANGSAVATVVFDDGGDTVELRGRAYYPYLEALGDRCTLGLDRLRSGSRVALVAGRLAADAPRTVAGIAAADPPMDAIILSLRGSSAAIGRLVSACRAAKLPEACPDR